MSTDRPWTNEQFNAYAATVGHRALAKHRPHEYCDECPYVKCRHCGDFGPRGTDHTCPCLYTDDECPDHPVGGLG